MAAEIQLGELSQVAEVQMLLAIMCETPLHLGMVVLLLVIHVVECIVNSAVKQVAAYGHVVRLVSVEAVYILVRTEVLHSLVQ